MKFAHQGMIRQWRLLIQTLGLRRGLNIYPPFAGAGIRVTDVNLAAGYVSVEMPLRVYNRGLVGTHFGGSLYAMCDPFYMFLLIERLGPEYIVWDRRGSIEYVAPGRGTVRARFEVTDEQLEAIRAAVVSDRKTEFNVSTEVFAADGSVVARVCKTLYIRKQLAPRRSGIIFRTAPGIMESARSGLPVQTVETGRALD